jgi:hypothetical protein
VDIDNDGEVVVFMMAPGCFFLPENQSLLLYIAGAVPFHGISIVDFYSCPLPLVLRVMHYSFEI